MKIENIEKNDKLYRFMEMVLSYNEKFNLTSITQKEQFMDKHFYDSLNILEDFDFSNKKVIDVGCGAGFPSIPLAIILKDTTFTLVESSHKKCDFLKIVKEELNLNNIEIINSRAEDLDISYRNYFDYAVSRAVASLNIILELTIPFIKVGGIGIFYKGLKYKEEINFSKKALAILHCHYLKTIQKELPFSKESRFYIIISKDEVSKNIYPRQFNKIKKEPL